MPVVSVVAHVRQVVDNAGFQSRPIYVHIGRYDPFVSFARVALDVRNGERPWRKESIENSNHRRLFITLKLIVLTKPGIFRHYKFTIVGLHHPQCMHHYRPLK